jgi:hypothetical protein
VRTGDWGGAAPGFDLLLIGDALAEADEAAALAGARVMRAGWAEAAAAMEAAASATVLLVEAEGAAAETLAERLPAIAAAAEARGMPVVATLAERDIDLVAGALMGPRAQLLCAPDLLDRVTALLAAARLAEAGPGATVRESDRERLDRLHAEVARIAEALARIGRGETPGGGTGADEVGDRRRDYDAGPGGDAPDPRAVRAAIRARRLRDGFFPAGLLEEPAWDMLLDLFAAELEGTRVSVSSLCIAAAVAPTTALRWIARMGEAGLFRRMPDPQDRRRAWIELSEAARTGMRGYWTAASRAGLIA